MSVLGTLLVAAAVLVAIGATPLAWILYGLAGLAELVVIPIIRAAMREAATQERVSRPSVIAEADE